LSSGNSLALVTGIIAAGLYGNIGISGSFEILVRGLFPCELIDGKIEVVYINIVENWMHGPRLMSKKGRVIWTGACPAFPPRMLANTRGSWHYSPYFLLLDFG